MRANKGSSKASNGSNAALAASIQRPATAIGSREEVSGSERAGGPTPLKDGSSQRERQRIDVPGTDIRMHTSDNDVVPPHPQPHLHLQKSSPVAQKSPNHKPPIVNARPPSSSGIPGPAPLTNGVPHGASAGPPQAAPYLTLPERSATVAPPARGAGGYSGQHPREEQSFQTLPLPEAQPTPPKGCPAFITARSWNARLHFGPGVAPSIPRRMSCSCSRSCPCSSSNTFDTRTGYLQ